jgi:Sulfatase
MNPGVGIRVLSPRVTAFVFCNLILLTGYARAQESRPEVPDVETPPEAQETTPIAADKKPNVVFILADNVGYGDLGSYGGGELRGAPTPRLDQLAQQGLRLTQYLVEPACTPSRAALMTGQYSIRSGLSLVIIPGTASTLPQRAFSRSRRIGEAESSSY